MAEAKRVYRTRCRVDDFPAEVRQRFEAMLSDVRYTYQDIAEEMKRLKYPISKSSIHRFAVRSEAAAQRIRAAAEQTRVLIQQIKDNQDVEATEVAGAILLDGLINRIATAEEEFDKLPLDRAGNLLVQLQRSGVYKNRWKDERKKTIEAVRDSLLSELKDEVQNDDELLEKLSGIVAKVAEKEVKRSE